MVSIATTTYPVAASTSYTTQKEPSTDEQYISTFFCRALYDYQTADASSLSFRKNDIIEVLTQLESGWWDGLLGDERGWFPSNYVTVISDQEAEAALGPSETTPSQPDDSQIVSQPDRNDEWMDSDMDMHNYSRPQTNGKSAHDFWVPQVSQDGRIFYVNTQTGQHSRDLPQEAEDDSEADLAGLTSQTPALTATTATAGFGVPSKRSHVPEPWVRRLADDGLSYYYVNKLNGTVSWTSPQSEPSTRNGNSVQRLRSDSATSSVHSDDSEVFPARRERSGSSASALVAGVPRRQVELAPAEQLARELQQALTASAEESPVELSNHVREAIASVTEIMPHGGSGLRRADQGIEMDQRVLEVVRTVRDLLYVTATPSGHIPSHLYPREARDARQGSANQPLQSHLKGTQRKVAGTLSKLVLSALAMQYDPGLSTSDKPNRMESDIIELERAIVAIVTEVHYFQEKSAQPQDQSRTGLKRLYGIFSTTNVGLGLPGAGHAGSWNGFGYVSFDNQAQSSLRSLAADQISELKITARAFVERLGAVTVSLKRSDFDPERLRQDIQNVIAYLNVVTDTIGNIDVARHVDVDGVRLESGPSVAQSQYTQTVDSARLLVRTMEAAVQSLYDDGIALLLAAQGLKTNSMDVRIPPSERDFMDTLVVGLIANANVTVQSLEALLAVGFDQSDISQGDYTTSIEWQKSCSVDIQDEDVVDMELAFSRPGARALNSIDSTQTSSMIYHRSSQSSDVSPDLQGRSRSGSLVDPVTPTWPEQSDSGTLVAQSTMGAESPDPLVDADEEDPSSSSKSPPRSAAAARKLVKLLGEEAPRHVLEKYNADSKPWYLRPNYDQSEILMDPDGAVRAGSPAALIERLTAHEHMDPTFNQNFLLTFKSFLTVDELFDLLVTRFSIEAPAGLSPAELDEWTKMKQQVIQARVLNIFKIMVTEDGILEKEDMGILGRLKEFASREDVVNSAAKRLLILIERAQRGEDAPIKISTAPLAPPPPVLPRSNKKLKLLDIEPVEIARQLTLMEFAMYKKIRPMECLLRSKETKPGRNSDNFSSIIQLSNRIANWVAETVLEKEDSRKRANIVKHFISVADRCRFMQNYSTMTAIVSGLATPPIRRLKRTWEQVNARFMTQLRDCESTLDTNKNFNNYRSTLARIAPPCVPFIGVYLTTLTFIHDGAEDRLAGNMINFRKRQKAAEVIQDIKRWQSKPYNLQTVASVLSFLEECFGKYNDGVDYADQFWNLSLEREPREREDEKMARLLQESGFL